MSAEFGKYWEEMEAIRKQMEIEEKGALEEAQRTLEEKTRQQEDLMVKATRIIVEIFEGIRNNHLDVKGAPNVKIRHWLEFDEIDLKDTDPGNSKWVVLLWGNKISADWDDYFSLYEYKFKDLTIPEAEVPEKIIMNDHYYLDVFITPVEVGVVHKIVRTSNDTVALSDDFPLADFVANPSIMLPAIVRSLRNPIHMYKEKRKGIDYWKDPEQT